MATSVRVWDLFVRIFHWSLVLLFATSYLTGEEEHWIHVYSGYGIVSLVILRVAWGFIGTRHARFSDFVHSPKVVLRYVRSILAGHPQRYLGHNPAGGAMVVAMLLTLALTTFSGLKLYAVEEGKGPFALGSAASLIESAQADDDDHAADRDHDEDEEQEELWEELHEAGVNMMLLLVLIHVAGVAVASRQHRESLVKAMFTGYKQDLR